MSAEQTTTGHSKPDGTRAIPHPLDQLSIDETDSARDVVLKARGSQVAIKFRSIFLHEPSKNQLSPFLDLENAGRITSTSPRPPRIAKVQYDVIKADRQHEYKESLVDITQGKEVHQRIVDKVHHASLTT